MSLDDMEKLQQSLWEKYATADRHGYKDWMGQPAFDAACVELLNTSKEATKKRRSKSQSKSNAMLEIIGDVSNRRPSPTSRKRIERAMDTLGLEGIDREWVLYRLDYTDKAPQEDSK